MKHMENNGVMMMTQVNKAHTPPQANQRGAARLAAVQALYQMDIGNAELNQTLAEFEAFRLGGRCDEEGFSYLKADAHFFRDIVSGVVREQRKLDPHIHKNLTKHWPLRRLDATLRAILRAGAFELDARHDIPARVVISEYIDVAQAFFEADETRMVNAVLDAIARQARPEEFEA